MNVRKIAAFCGRWLGATIGIMTEKSLKACEHENYSVSFAAKNGAG
jgi:hypothetical protein